MRLNKKINKFLKKVNIPFTIISLFFCILGLIFMHINGFAIYSNISFIIATIFTGFPIFIKAIQALFSKVIGIELLVVIAVIGALIIKEYSEAGIVTFLFQFGAILELKTLEKTRNEMKTLINMAPKWAIRINGENKEDVDVSDIEIGDLILINAGDMVAVDGVIENGEGYFNEASITGESKLIKKGINDYVYSGSILDNGSVVIKAKSVGDEATFNKIINLVEEATNSKSRTERFIDKFARWYTPLVIFLALLTLILTKIIGGTFDIDKSITVLVLACPGALVIGVPVASVAGIGALAKKHILLKGGDRIQTFSKCDVVVLDKTGTLTKGNTIVIDCKYYGDDINYDLGIAKGMENLSNHPLKNAIINYGNINPINVSNIDTIKGIGLYYKENDEYFLGGLKLLNNKLINYKDILNDVDKIKQNGSTISILIKNNKVIAIYEIVDEIRDDAYEFIQNLKKQGIKKTIMITGDNEYVAEYVRKKLKIDEAYANLLPGEKLNKLEKLKKDGNNITFIGDGINDAPAIAFADTGIAMGSGTDVAIETSDVVIMRSKLSDVNLALKMSKRILKISYENIFIAVGTVIFLIIGLFMGFIHMSIGMFVHEGSILIVIFNAMRLLRGEKNEKN